MIRSLNNQRGMAIAIALAVLLMLGLIGIAVIRTSVTDMDISKALTDKSKSFYVADGGLEYAISTMQASPKIVDADSVMKFLLTDTALGDGYFKISMDNLYPIRTITSVGYDQAGESAVAMSLRHRRNPINPWDNAIFAGVGQSGRAIAGNVDFHGSVHILGDGEDFTDDNGNGKWDDADTFTDLNGDGVWQPGEPLTTDADGDGKWDPAEPYVDDNGNGAYDETLTATDLSFDATGTAAIMNNYEGIGATLESRIPPLTTIPFNGEDVYSLDAELRVKHGMVNLSGTALVGDEDVSGGSPAIKETMDGVYVNDGFGGDAGTGNVYSDNGTSETYDLGDAITFPSLNDSISGYPDHRSYLKDNALVISGDLTLTPGVSYSASGPKGSLTVDAAGNITISGIVVVTGSVYFTQGGGKLGKAPFVYDGRGTLAAAGDMHINNSIITKGTFPTDDVMGFIAYHNMEIGTADYASQLDLMGAFYAQQQISNAHQNQIAGTIMSNYFSVADVPSIYQVPALVDNLPPGMPGGATIFTYIWKPLASTWHEL